MAKSRYSYDLFLRIGANLVDYMKKTGQFPKRPEQVESLRNHVQYGVFGFFANNEDQRKYFNDYMAIRREGLSSWHEVFPMASHLGPGVSRDDRNAVLLVEVLLVEVGGKLGPRTEKLSPSASRGAWSIDSARSPRDDRQVRGQTTRGHPSRGHRT